MTVAINVSRDTREAPNSREAAMARAILDRQSRREAATRTYARRLPSVPVRATGTVVHGADGRRHLGCPIGAGTCVLGLNHPAAVDAIRVVPDAGAPPHVLDIATPIKDASTSVLYDTLPTGFGEDARIHFRGLAGADAIGATPKRAATCNEAVR